MSANIFNSVMMKRPNKNKFDLTHDVKMTGKMGLLMPCLAMECLPSDKFILGADTLVRFAPMLAPIMHRVDVSVHYFFVPNRILWDGWEPWIVNDESDPRNFPYITIDNSFTDLQKRFLDYLGIPPYVGTTSVNVSALPLAAYQCIYNEYYRDQNLVAEVDWKLTDGDNSSNADLITMRKRAWEHDYFTAGLPFAQKGTAVEIPLGKVILDDESWNPTDAPDHRPSFRDKYGANAFAQYQVLAGTAGVGNVNITGNGLSPAELAYDPNGTLITEPTTINDLRRAFKLQEWLEKNARGGTRYVENLLVHFALKPQDARLQRPEYITGIKAPVVISEVLNTNGPFDTYDGSGLAPTGSAQGDMAGHGVAVTAGKNGAYFCQEHGYIIGIISIMPKTAYQQGIPKHYLKDSFLDMGWPTFAHLGEQAVLNNEIFAYQADGSDTFAYVPRYSEYKFMPSRVAGDFRNSLDFWHLGRIFDDPPTLNQQFIECSPENVSRIFAVEDGTDNLWMHILHRITAIRPLPRYGTPSI